MPHESFCSALADQFDVAPNKFMHFDGKCDCHERSIFRTGLLCNQFTCDAYVLSAKYTGSTGTTTSTKSYCNIIFEISETRVCVRVEWVRSQQTTALADESCYDYK